MGAREAVKLETLLSGLRLQSWYKLVSSRRRYPGPLSKLTGGPVTYFKKGTGFVPSSVELGNPDHGK